MFYHKALGVTTFFLFVEGKAASPDVSKVLESIPVSYYFACESIIGIFMSLICLSINVTLLSGGKSDIQDERARGETG